ncbi:hypothetical protein LEMLEM_LOCUS3133 [Lemmus lemmus]
MGGPELADPGPIGVSGESSKSSLRVGALAHVLPYTPSGPRAPTKSTLRSFPPPPSRVPVPGRIPEAGSPRPALQPRPPSDGGAAPGNRALAAPSSEQLDAPGPPRRLNQPTRWTPAAVPASAA